MSIQAINLNSINFLKTSTSTKAVVSEATQEPDAKKDNVNSKISSQIQRNYGMANVSFKRGGCAAALVGTALSIGAAITAPTLVDDFLGEKSREWESKKAKEMTSEKVDVVNFQKARLNKEKDMLLKKDMSEEEFMSRLVECQRCGLDEPIYLKQMISIQRKDKWDDDFRNQIEKKESEVLDEPIYLEKMRDVQQEIYSNLTEEQKKEIYDVRNFLMNSVSKTLKDEISMGSQSASSLKEGSITGIMGTVLGTGGGFVHGSEKVDSEYAKDVQEKALAVVSVLQRLSESDIIIRTGGKTDQSYKNAVQNFTNLYFESDGMPINPSHTAEVLKQVRDKIANEMTPAEKAQFEAKYDDKMEQFDNLISSTEVEQDTESSPFPLYQKIAWGILILIFGITGSLKLMDKIEGYD